MSSILGGQKQEAGGILPRLPAIAPTLRTGAGSGLQTDLHFGRFGDSAFLKGATIDASLAPQIGEIREETLGGIRNLIGDVQGDIQTLRGLENPFIQARVNPFIAQREAAARSAARRGVQGPLAALATNPFTAQIADQRALALQESQQAIGRGQQQIQSLLQDQSGQGAQLLQQELALLGLEQQEVQDIIASQLSQAQETGALRERPNLLQGSGQLAGGIGGALAGAAKLAPFLGICWVAREVYGEHNPRWQLFRLWLFNKAPVWLFKLYMKHGERFARWLRNKPRCKRVIRWAMDKVIKHG